MVQLHCSWSWTVPPKNVESCRMTFPLIYLALPDPHPCYLFYLFVCLLGFEGTAVIYPEWANFFYVPIFAWHELKFSVCVYGHCPRRVSITITSIWWHYLWKNNEWKFLNNEMRIKLHFIFTKQWSGIVGCKIVHTHIENRSLSRCPSMEFDLFHDKQYQPQPGKVGPYTSRPYECYQQQTTLSLRPLTEEVIPGQAWWTPRRDLWSLWIPQQNFTQDLGSRWIPWQRACLGPWSHQIMHKVWARYRMPNYPTIKSMSGFMIP